MGRQPWSVYGALRTADAVTPALTVEAVTVSLIIFLVVYLVIFGFGTLYVYRLSRAGPVESKLVLPLNPKRPLAVPGGNAVPEIVQGSAT